MKPIDAISDRLSRAQSAFVRRLFLDRQAAFWREELEPHTLKQQRLATVLDVIDETPDTKTFVLRPDREYRGHEAGQYVPVEVEVDGVRLRRMYSLSSTPGAETIAITVKRVPDGRVSGWLHAHVHVGDLLDVGAARGDFRLPAGHRARDRDRLFISAGSGITPVMSMLRHLAATRELDETIRETVFVHYARSRADVIFHDELQRLATWYPSLRLVLCLDDATLRDPSVPRGFDEESFVAMVPDFAERETYLCGPTPVMERVTALYARHGAEDRLSQEAFVSAPAVRPARPGEPSLVTLRRAGRDVLVDGPGTLLEQLERAGAEPDSGCRMGICHTCRCTKARGTVENLVTGEISSDPDQEIQLCISAARSDLELML